LTTTELIAGTKRLQEMIGLRHDPLAFFYADQAPEGYQPAPDNRGCLVGVLTRARGGETVYFSAETVGCPGGGYYLGFCEARPEIDFFVSTGIPGKLAGERYKQSPELVRAFRERHPAQPAPARYAVFAPVASLAPEQTPLVIICFAGPDELAGLVGLAGYARAEDAVVVPFGSGCGVMVTQPLAEAKRPQPRAYLGLFDPSARPCVEADELSFSAPLALWLEMLGNAEESFLQTPTWAKLRRRIAETAERSGEEAG
jgi:uncharacterized protein (DUF169 family)